MRDFLVVYFGPGSRLRWVLLALAVLVLGWIAAQAQEMVLDRRVSASTDDAEESATGSVTKASSDLELVYDGTNQVVGMRFLDIAVPQGATITSAWIQFTADESQSEPTSLSIRAHLPPPPPPLPSFPLPPRGRGGPARGRGAPPPRPRKEKGGGGAPPPGPGGAPRAGGGETPHLLY